MDEREIVRELLEKMGGRFSTALGIDLDRGDSGEIFKWFLASILFGARISETLASRTYLEFACNGVITPDKILETGWDGLVYILDAGGYVRYDFKTATKLLEVMRALKEGYDGDLNRLHAASTGPRDLEAKLMALGKGIGQVTVNIFLRELRGVWEKAEPLPQALAVMAARNLGLVQTEEREAVLNQLKALWERCALTGWKFADFESALVRLGKDYCRRQRCTPCPMASRCRRQGQ